MPNFIKLFTMLTGRAPISQYTSPSSYRAKVLILAALTLFLFFLELSIFPSGILYFQGPNELIYTLDNRPLINKVFDPATLDWGLYRAREIMYLFFVGEHYVTYFLAKLGLVKFFEFGHYLFLLLILFTIFHGKSAVINTRVFFFANALLLLNFFLMPNVFLGGLESARPGKIAVVFGIVWLFYIFVKDGTNRRGGNYFLAFLASSLLGLVDEMGYVFILISLAILLCFLILKPSTKLAWLSSSVLLGALFHPLYNRIIGPKIIDLVNHYPVSFSFQDENHLKSVSYDAFLKVTAEFFKQFGAIYGGNNVYFGCAVLFVLLLGFIWLDVKRFKQEGAEKYSFNYLNPAKYYSVLMCLVLASVVFLYTIIYSIAPTVMEEGFDLHYYFLPLSAVVFITNLTFINLILKFNPRLSLLVSATLLVAMTFNITNTLDYLYSYSFALRNQINQTSALASCLGNRSRPVDSFAFEIKTFGPSYDYAKLCTFLRNKVAYDELLPNEIILSDNDQQHVNELGIIKSGLKYFKEKYKSYPNTDGQFVSFNFCGKLNTSEALSKVFGSHTKDLALVNKLKSCTLDYSYKSDGDSYKLIFDKPSDCGLTTFKYPYLKDAARSCTKDSTTNICLNSSAGFLTDNKCWSYGYHSASSKDW